ncbi:uncharacterized protein LOC133181971 [Saccostrea echinata]|uniref:uncharacterized protein LOC133181971 n=1 Tax=Saccostrea echinata TaxID=191078 RepID=UPI002A821E52|nr:uncharacterized protein LOC133181971 [Saccostrea echinata]
MSSYKDSILDAKVINLHKVVENGRQRFICFTKMGTYWSLNVTDGLDVWRLEMDEDEFESHRELSETSSKEAFLLKIRKGFTDGDLSVAMIGNKITLTIGKGASALTFDLYECKAAEKKIELQELLFKLALSSSKLEEELAVANKTIETLKSQTSNTGAGNSALDIGSKRESHTKPKPKKVGMSVVNPTSKKRKAAHGVVFD